MRNDSKDGDIEGIALIDNSGSWRWTASPGQHRVAVVAALGFKTIPVRIKKIVYKNEVDYWPNVTSGLYTKNGALKLFDRIFHGDVMHLPRWNNNTDKEINKLFERMNPSNYMMS